MYAARLRKVFRHSRILVGMDNRAAGADYPSTRLPDASEKARGFGPSFLFFWLIRSLGSIQWIADSKTKNQPRRRYIDERNEPETG
jgi:hypothetical protein